MLLYSILPNTSTALTYQLVVNFEWSGCVRGSRVYTEPVSVRTKSRVLFNRPFLAPSGVPPICGLNGRLMQDGAVIQSHTRALYTDF